MKIAEKILTLQAKHFSQWVKTRQEVDNEISSKQTMFCVCGKLATGLHERTCRKYIQIVNAKTVEKLKHLI